MPDTSETNSVDTDNDVDSEPEHNLEWALKDQESFRYDDDLPLYDAWAIARAEVRRLQAVVADQALTIGTLKDEAARKAALFQEYERLLSEERKLTAATAEHTTALERKVGWYERREAAVRRVIAEVVREPEEIEALEVRDRAVELRDWVRANPKPGAPVVEKLRGPHLPEVYECHCEDCEPEPGATP